MRGVVAFFRGTVELEARGTQIEKFLNLLYRAGISPCSLRRTEEGTLLFSLLCKEFKRIRSAAFKTGTRVRILQKRGFFRVIRPFRRRWGLVVGFGLFLGLLLYTSGFIWQIEVIGCEQSSSTRILNDLRGLGFGLGTRRTIDVDAIENRYLMGNDRLSWMSINIRGTTAYIEVREKGASPEVLDPTVPTHIVAARDGVILSIRDYGGDRQVEVGEPVSAGDLLVSGDRTDQYGVRHLTHSIATVTAETRRETTVEVPLREEIREKTGRKRKKITISLGKLKIPLYFTKKISYNEYDTVQKETPLRIGTFALPIRFSVSCAEEVQTSTVTRTAQQAKAEALTRLGFYERDTLSHAVIRRRKLQETLEDGVLRLSAVYYCEEEIGIELPIEE